MYHSTEKVRTGHFKRLSKMSSSYRGILNAANFIQLQANVRKTEALFAEEYSRQARAFRKCIEDGLASISTTQTMLTARIAKLADLHHKMDATIVAWTENIGKFQDAVNSLGDIQGTTKVLYSTLLSISSDCEHLNAVSAKVQ